MATNWPYEAIVNDHLNRIFYDYAIASPEFDFFAGRGARLTSPTSPPRNIPIQQQATPEETFNFNPWSLGTQPPAQRGDHGSKIEASLGDFSVTDPDRAAQQMGVIGPAMEALGMVMGPVGALMAPAADLSTHMSGIVGPIDATAASSLAAQRSLGPIAAAKNAANDMSLGKAIGLAAGNTAIGRALGFGPDNESTGPSVGDLSPAAMGGMAAVPGIGGMMEAAAAAAASSGSGNEAESKGGDVGAIAGGADLAGVYHAGGPVIKNEKNATLAAGEFVLRPEAVEMLGLDNLAALNTASSFGIGLALGNIERKLGGVR